MVVETNQTASLLAEFFLHSSRSREREMEGSYAPNPPPCQPLTKKVPDFTLACQFFNKHCFIYYSRCTGGGPCLLLTSLPKVLRGELVGRDIVGVVMSVELAGRAVHGLCVDHRETVPLGDVAPFVDLKMVIGV